MGALPAHLACGLRLQAFWTSWIFIWVMNATRFK